MSTVQALRYGDTVQLVHVATGNVLHTLTATVSATDVSASTVGLRTLKYVAENRYFCSCFSLLLL